MGRKKKYLSEEERIEAQKRWNMEYYERNKEVIRKKALERYYGRENKH